MNSYIKRLENALTEDQKDMLSRIYEPTVVATPMSDSRRDLCILPDGEIRSYGKLYVDHYLSKDGTIAYLSSKDGGLSWTRHYSKGKMNSCTYLEKAGLYITTCDKYNNSNGIESGVYVYRSAVGPDDPDPEVIRVLRGEYADSFLPQESCFTDRIWFTTQREGRYPVFCFSDDFGKTWEVRELPCPHDFKVVFPHKGLRWCRGSGVEPQVAELSRHVMKMILRTPMDCFYASYSKDGGNTWSDPEPTTFYGTTTTAFQLRLSDGRLITFWNNTVPLPQVNLSRITPPVNDFCYEGKGEIGFTNRDVAHAAITENGTDFIGYREILLNPIRNRSDFRYVGGIASSGDKSSHQFQAYELPFHKVLVSVGQNVASRRLVIFDVDWLYETKRKETFTDGLIHVTTHTYRKSIYGSHTKKVGNGACSLNRETGAFPMPDPEGSYREVLSVSKREDPTLLSQIRGMCWNFPASKKGSVSFEVLIAEKTARFLFSDRWYNTCDPYAVHSVPFWFELDAEDLGAGYHTVRFDFDTEKGEGAVYLDACAEPFFLVQGSAPCPTGISYLIAQCAPDGDSEGFFLASMEKTDVSR